MSSGRLYFSSKKNQEQLLEEIKDEFRFYKNIETDINIDYGH